MTETRTPEEILAHRLDFALPPDKTTIPPQTPDALVSAAAHIAKIHTPQLSDIALAQIENKMLAAFDKQYRVQRRHQSRRWVSHVSRWAVAASFILVLLVAGLVPASAGSLPGEPLYGVKRFVERVELALAPTPDTAARLRLEHATRRVNEALALLERDQFNFTPLEEALAELKKAQQGASSELEASLTFQWQQRTVRKLIQIAMMEAQNSGNSEILPVASPNPTDTPQPSATATRTPRPTLTPTNVLGDEDDEATDCPGNSCNSAGVPGGQIDPENPPGQSGGRDDSPPTPPGQGDPGGGHGNNQGQGDPGGGQGNNQGQGNSGSGGSAWEPPPPNSGENSNNSAGNGNGGGAPEAPPANSGGSSGNAGDNGSGGAPPESPPGNPGGNSGNAGGNGSEGGAPVESPQSNAGGNSVNSGNNGNGGGNGHGNGG